MKYQQIVAGLSLSSATVSTGAGSTCPEGVEWHEVVAGSWPEMKTRQLILHAAACDHCGPLLRAATREAGQAKAGEAAAATPNSELVVPQRRSWHILRWAIPLGSVTMVLAVLLAIPLSSIISGTKYAEFAARAHGRHVRGNLHLDVRLDSQQALNEWLRKNAQFAVALPASAELPGEKRPYRIEGASLVPVGGQRAVFIAYQVDSGPASLMIAPYKVAVASGGVEARFKKVTFHYRTVEGLKVVTWSQHGLTYALVSHEGNATQKSCMVCHSAMRDRDLSQTPTPLKAERNPRSFLQ